MARRMTRPACPAAARFGGEWADDTQRAVTRA